MQQLVVFLLLSIVLVYSDSVSIQYGKGIGKIDSSKPPVYPLGLLTLDLKTGARQERTNLFKTATAVYSDAVRGHAWVLEPDTYSPRLIRVYDISGFIADPRLANSTTWTPTVFANITDTSFIESFKNLAFSPTTLHFTQVGGSYFMLGPNYGDVTIEAWNVTDLKNVTFVNSFQLKPLNVGPFRWLATDDETNGKYLYIGLGSAVNGTGVLALGLNKLDQGIFEVGTLIKNVSGTEKSTRVRTWAYGDALWLTWFSEGISYYNISNRLDPVLVDHLDNHPDNGITLGNTDGCTTDNPYEIYIHHRITNVTDKFERATLVNGKIEIHDTTITYPDCDTVAYPTPCQIPGSLLRCIGYTDSDKNSKLVVIHSRGLDLWDPQNTTGTVNLVATYSTRCEDVEWGSADAVNGVFLAVTPNIPSCNCPDPGAIPCPALPRVVTPSSLANDNRLIPGGYIDYFGVYDAPALDITTVATVEVILPDIPIPNSSVIARPSLCDPGTPTNLKDKIALSFYPPDGGNNNNCGFSDMIDKAKGAGAACVFIINNLPGPVGIWGVGYDSPIPAGIIAKAAGEAIYDALILNSQAPSPQTQGPTPQAQPPQAQPPQAKNFSTVTQASISLMILVESVLFFLFIRSF